MQWIWGRRAETAPLVNRASQTEGKASPGKGPQQRVAKGGGGSSRARESAQQQQREHEPSREARRSAHAPQRGTFAQLWRVTNSDWFQWLCPGGPLQTEAKGHLNANIMAWYCIGVDMGVK